MVNGLNAIFSSVLEKKSVKKVKKDKDKKKDKKKRKKKKQTEISAWIKVCSSDESWNHLRSLADLINLRERIKQSTSKLHSQLFYNVQLNVNYPLKKKTQELTFF